MSFLSYGIGSGLIDSMTNTSDFLSHVHAEKVTMVIGVILVGLVHTFVNIGLPVIVLPILKPYNARLAYGYLCAAILATSMLAVGAIFLLLLVPLSEVYVEAGTALAPNIEAMGMLLKKGGYYSYHMGMALWSMGGFMFVSILFKSNLIPRSMSVWGFMGYLFLVSGSVMALFEHSVLVETVSAIPGGLFEIMLSVLLIVKGFNSSAMAPMTAATDDHQRSELPSVQGAF